MSAVKRTTRIRAVAVGVAAAATIGVLSQTGGLFAKPVTISQTQHAKIDTGILDIALRDGDTYWRQHLKNIAAGDAVITNVALVNVGDAPLGHLEIAATGTGKLLTGKTPATVSLTTCAVPFRSGKCASGLNKLTGNIVGQRAGTDLHLNQGERIYLQVRAYLPRSADNSYQKASGVLDYVFTGTQALLEQAPKPQGKR